MATAHAALSNLHFRVEFSVRCAISVLQVIGQGLSIGIYLGHVREHTGIAHKVDPVTPVFASSFQASWGVCAEPNRPSLRSGRVVPNRMGVQQTILSSVPSVGAI